MAGITAPSPPSWNVLATAREREHRHLAKRLKPFGDFWWTAFLGVLIGRVEDHEAFFEQWCRQEETDPGFLEPLAKLVPIDRTFDFTVETFVDQLKAAVLPYIEWIGSGSFYVRLERRGHRGDIHSPEVERLLDEVLREALEAKGKEPTISFKDPDLIVAVKTIGEMCGVGAIPRTLRIRYPFVRVP